MRTLLARSLCSFTVLIGACGDNFQPAAYLAGTVSGLEGDGLVLRSSTGDELELATSGPFQFPTPVVAGDAYEVTVIAQPSSPPQICKIANGIGTVSSTAHVARITVTCETSEYSVGGTVSGLAGSGLVLQNNGGDDLAISANGTFTFPTPVASGAAFAVTVETQPSGPTQTCTVSGATGTIGAGPVTTVVVDCAVDRFTVGGTITGLAGTAVLHNNGGDAITVSSSGDFAFPTTVASGETYDVTVAMHPGTPSQTCAVTSGGGTVTDADITSVQVECTTNRFTVGGTVTGLAGTGLVLQNSGGDDLAIDASGAFAFTTPVASGDAFSVTVLAQPSGPTQTCTVSGGAGTVGGGDVTSVTVNCATNRYTISGTIAGLADTVVLQNNGGDDLLVTANGGFAFPVTVASGEPYDVSVLVQPAVPSQTCVVTAGAGTVVNADITDVAVTCTTDRFTVGGTVSGLAAGAQLVLRNNGGDDLALTTNGAFTFQAPVTSGQPYAVAVHAHPSAPIAQTCTVAGGSGIVGGEDVTTVAVTCTTNTYTVGGTVIGLLPGDSLVLQNHGTDDLPITADGAFTFDTPVTSGATYAVTIVDQPSDYNCDVENATGTITNVNVTDVVVTCRLRSCAQLLQAIPDLPSGDYSIDPDAGGPEPARTVYCDMTTDGGGWTNLDFENDRVLLDNGIVVYCTMGLTVTATSITCDLPYFGPGRTLPLYHGYCDGTDSSADYILDHMAPLLGHQASLDLGFTSLAQSFGRHDFDYLSMEYDERCYIDGELVPWNDARCFPYNSGGNGDCIPHFFTLTL